MIKQFNDSQAQVAYLREYAPDVVAALSDVGQAGSNYDANGHFVRSSPDLFPFTLDGQNQLTMPVPLAALPRPADRPHPLPGSGGAAHV